jgi:hypothetical protein
VWFGKEFEHTIVNERLLKGILSWMRMRMIMSMGRLLSVRKTLEYRSFGLMADRRDHHSLRCRSTGSSSVDSEGMMTPATSHPPLHTDDLISQLDPIQSMGPHIH